MLSSCRLWIFVRLGSFAGWRALRRDQFPWPPTSMRLPRSPLLCPSFWFAARLDWSGVVFCLRVCIRVTGGMSHVWSAQACFVAGSPRVDSGTAPWLFHDLRCFSGPVCCHTHAPTPSHRVCRGVFVPLEDRSSRLTTPGPGPATIARALVPCPEYGVVSARCFEPLSGALISQLWFHVLIHCCLDPPPRAWTRCPFSCAFGSMPCFAAVSTGNAARPCQGLRDAGGGGRSWRLVPAIFGGVSHL